MQRVPFLLSLLLSLLFNTACASSGGSPHPLLSQHQMFSLDAGRHWQITQQLDPRAELQVGRKDQRAFILIYAYDRNQMQYPGLKPFAKLSTEQLMQGLNNPQAEPPLAGHIDSRPTVVYALTGESKGDKIFYFSAAIEGKHAIYWVVAWCLASDYEKVGDDLINTFFTLRET